MKQLLLLLLFSHVLMGQNQKSFKIVGKSSFYNNKELIISAAGIDKDYLEISIDSAFDKVDFPMRYVQVKNNAFEITGHLTYPVPMQVSYEYMVDGKMEGASSIIFFAQEGATQVKVNNLQIQHIELSDISGANLEFLKIKQLYKHLEKEGQSTDIHEKHRILNTYIKDQPDSYVALWITILDYATSGYISEIFDNTVLFSDEIKASKPYKTLVSKLNVEKTLVVGLPMSVSILPTQYRDFNKNKYTLIEFWATWCKPCLALMPALKNIYGNYKSKGFEIYGISNDTEDKKALYEKTLKKYSMNWNNIIAPDVANNWNINSLPSNFLIDSEGLIIAIDISTEELEKFLKEKLNN